MEFPGLTQIEQLKVIGSKLSEARQQKSVSLEEIAAKTYIPLRLLNAIEAGRLEQLPEPVFIQGFIRRYADAIGLDGSSMSKEFSLDAAPTPAPAAPVAAIAPPPIPAAAPPPEVRQPVVAKEVAKEPAPFAASEPSYPQESRKLPLVPIAAAIGLGALGLIIVNALNRPQTAQTPPAVKTASTASTAPAKPKPSQAPASPTASVAPAASPSASPVASGPVEVKMNVTEDSWVEVLVDGQPSFEGTLTKGTQKTWSGKKEVVVSAGNAGGVSVSYNNAAAKPIGANGEVKTASFPPAP